MSYDVVVIGAGPGGLQACIHLGRYNFQVLLCHVPGGRTRYAKHLENYLGIPETSGPKLIETGLAQARKFGVTVENARVERVTGREGEFEVTAGGTTYRSRYVVAASGARESLAPYRNLDRFFGHAYYTCMICDGYRTTGRKLVVVDRTANGIRSSVAMKRMYTPDVTFVADGFSLPPVYRSLLEEEGIPFVEGRVEELLGEARLEGVRLQDGRVVPGEAILGWGGVALNDEYLAALDPERDADGFKFVARANGESSVPGLFIVGALRTGHSQAITSAGQGAEAAIEISSRVVEI